MPFVNSTRMILTRNASTPSFRHLGVHFQEIAESSSGIFEVKRYFLSLSHGQASLQLQVKRLLQLILVMPAMNATSERSFSALRRLKNCLRTTMTQERLNHLMLLYVHKERTDSLDLKAVLNEFVGVSEHALVFLLSIT